MNVLHGDLWSAGGEWHGGGGRVLRREDVRRSRGAQNGVYEVRGGPGWDGFVEALGGGWRCFSSTLRCHCFDDMIGLAWAGRWRRHPWRSCFGAQGTAARPGRRFLGGCLREEGSREEAKGNLAPVW
jgi:hypothetical protein